MTEKEKNIVEGEKIPLKEEETPNEITSEEETEVEAPVVSEVDALEEVPEVEDIDEALKAAKRCRMLKMLGHL